MAVINFVKGEQYYTAEFQINGPVNVHIERAEAGALYFRQRSIDHGSYDLINGANWNNRGDLTIDTAIQGVVYPMWIKIESASEPTLAEMVEGEQSGGGAGTESTMEYLDVSGVDFVNGGNKEGSLLMVSFMVKCNHTILGDNAIVPIGQLYVAGTSKTTSVHALAFDFSVRYIVNTGTTNVSLKEALIQTGWAEEELAAIPRITKEQFYSLEA